MKKRFISLFAVLLYMSANSQILTYVGNNANVTVTSNTLLYNGGGLQTAGVSKVDNYGNIMIRAVSSDRLTLDGTSSFNLKLNTTSDYGQLYINGITQANITGKINKEYRADANSGETARQQIALPFVNYTIADLVNDITVSPLNTGGNYINSTNGGNTASGRFSPNSMFRWNNARARFDQIVNYAELHSTTNVGGPLDYYILPRRNAAGTVVWNAAGSGSVTTFKGIPASDVSGNQSLSLTGAAAGISFGYNGFGANTYGERYNTYLDDPFQSKTGNAGGWDANYGKNLYHVANPFLTNIDLKYIGQNESPNSDGNNIPNLQGVAYYTSGLSWSRLSGTSYPSAAGQLVKMTATGGVFQSGDVDARRLIIKPLGEFMIKLSTDNGSNINSKIDFSALRRFSATSRDKDTQTTNPTSRFNDGPNISADKVVKQLAVILMDSDSLEVARTYYAVSPSAVTGNNSELTSIQAYEGDGSLLYTKEELVSGGEDFNKSDKLYINEANEVDFESKKIPLYIKYNNGSYILRFEVYEKGERVYADGLSNGKNFYIETSDKTFVKINDGDHLNMSGQKEIGVYYEKPSTSTLGTNNISLNETIIARKGSNWVVRFSKQWSTAKVDVFSASGQLINSRTSISTSEDYIIPINREVKSTFVVKATSDKGDVVVKKILN